MLNVLYVFSFKPHHKKTCLQKGVFYMSRLIYLQHQKEPVRLPVLQCLKGAVTMGSVALMVDVMKGKSAAIATIVVEMCVSCLKKHRVREFLSEITHSEKLAPISGVGRSAWVVLPDNFLSELYELCHEKTCFYHMSLVKRKPVVGVLDQG